jgi:RNA polymerase sigma factor (sigma-70 family)
MLLNSDLLTEQEKTVLILKFLEEQTYKEIAERMGLLIVNIHDITKKALGKLKKCLDYK